MKNLAETLLRKYKQHGLLEDRNRLLMLYDEKIKKIAGRYKFSQINFYDLHQEAYIGAIKAVEQYQINSSYNLESYVITAAKRQIWRFISANFRGAMNLPYNKHQQTIFFNRSKIAYKESYNHSDCMFLSEKLKVPYSEVCMYFSCYQKTTVENDENEFFDSYLDTVCVTDPSSNPEKIIEKEEFFKKIDKILESEEEIYRFGVINCLIGLEDYGSKTVTDLANKKQMSRNSMQLKINKIINKIRSQFVEPHMLTTIKVIEKICCQQYGVKRSDIHSKKRTKLICFTRNLIMYLAKQHTFLSLQEIANYLDRLDHTTVLKSIRQIKTEITKNNLDKDVEKLLSKITNSI